jgi:hypothetical protein
MVKRYLSDFEQGYFYARQRYRDLAEGLGRAALLDLAGALRKTTGSDAELARGIAAGISEMVQAEKEEG